MNFTKSILIITLFFFTAMQSQTMVTTNIQSPLLNKYWCPNMGDPYEVVFRFTQYEVTLFVGGKNIGSEPYYITSNSEVTTPTTFNNAKVGTTNSGNCIKTNSSYFIIEFFSDFKSFRWKRSFDPQQIWQTYTQVNGTPYFNTAKSGEFTKNSCGDGNIGYPTVYEVEAGKHMSFVSQAAADAKATEDVAKNGQDYANSNSWCTYYNVETTRDVVKNDCPLGKVGSKVSYTLPAGTFMSELSEADLAIYVDSAFKQLGAGQQYANAQGSCGYNSKYLSGYFIKNNCATAGTVGLDPVFFKVPEAKYFSTVSQSAADELALADLNLNGQINANNTSLCYYQNVAQSANFTRNNCVTGGIGSTVVYTVNAKQHISSLSQADSDAKAMAAVNTNGQNYANYICTCTFKSKALTNVPFRKNNCIAPKVGSYVNYSAAAGAFTSTISQADADARARIAGQANANLNGSCN